jgi:uncharacterized DUF497 family protein
LWNEEDVVMMDLRFEWDPGKAARNAKKHGVSFDEAATIFHDPMFITVIDQEHSSDEERYITIGLSSDGRLLIIAHTDREGQVRIISARKATKKEEQFYAEAA